MPGSMASFLHGFFDAIDLSKPIGNRGSESIRALHPAVQRAMFVNKPLAMGVYQRRVVSRQLLRWLERVGDLDALAGAIILLREAAERCNHALAFEIGMSVHRLLLAATITGPARQLRSEIAVVVLFRILRIAKSNGREFVPDLEQFWAAGNNLRLAICAADDWSNEPVSGKRAYDFLAGRPGSDLYFKFRATTALDSTQAEWPVESQVDVYTERKYSEWAWSISIFERERKPIPAQVTDEIARGIKAIRARNDPRLFPPELADADKRTFEQWLHIPRLTERPAIHGSGMERHPLLNSVDDTARSPRLPQLACALYRVSGIPLAADKTNHCMSRPKPWVGPLGATRNGWARTAQSAEGRKQVSRRGHRPVAGQPCRSELAQTPVRPEVGRLIYPCATSSPAFSGRNPACPVRNPALSSRTPVFS
jgi:hypothetical protein